MYKLNALSKVAISFGIFNIIFLPFLSFILPIPLLIAEKQSSSLVITATLQIYALFMLASMVVSIFPIAGPSPSDKWTLKWTANQRELSGGANIYEYACVLPLSRKQLIKPLALIWLPLITINAAEIIMAAVINYSGEAAPIIAFHSLTFFFILICVPLTCFIYRKIPNVSGLVIIFISIPVVFIVMFAFMLSDEIIPSFMPASAAIALPVIGVIFNFLMLYFTGLNGDYARNGEKISNH